MKSIFPKKIPIFPLNGVIYFPRTNLPLNIFEQRYLDLVNDTMKSNKLMGMVQSKKNSDDVYKVGCLGKISEFKKAKDGRVLINLTGITRFEIKEEIKNNKSYREFEVLYEKFNGDDSKSEDNLIVKPELFEHFSSKIKTFFERKGLILNWEEFKKIEQDQQINTLAMISPVSSEEKQKLLETKTLKDKTEILLNIVEFYLHDNSYEKKTIQ
tara:strand:+ start:71 stop:706 length:636 start_codon:yes stop_codon:yes gene_type:complete